MRSLNRGPAPRTRVLATDGPTALVLPIALSIMVLLLTFVGAIAMYQVTYAERIFLGVSAMGIDLGGLTPDEARTILESRYERFAQTPITLRYEGREWRPTARELGMLVRVDDTITQAYNIGREGSFIECLSEQLYSFQAGRVVSRPIVDVDASRQLEYLTQVAQETDQAPVNAELVIKPGPQVVIQRGRPGRQLDVGTTADLIQQSIITLTGASVELIVGPVLPALTDSDLLSLKAQVDQMMSGPVIIQLEEREWPIERQRIASIISLRESEGAPDDGPVNVNIDDTRLAALIEEVATEVNRNPENARFDFVGGHLQVTWPGEDGLQVQIEEAVEAVKAAMTSDDRIVSLPVAVTRPAIGPEDGPSLGIRDFIEEARTPYAVGSADRQHNIQLAAARLHGVVVPPGEVFSFNEAVGEVSGRTGYRTGYAITQTQHGEVQTIPAEGGGICQVATTLFHTIFWSGYPVIERNWHLYWIARYGQPPTGLKGLDATIDQIYDGQGNLVYSVDLKFRNDTEGYLLIQSRTIGGDLIIQFYGTKPNWEVKVPPPTIENVMKADPTPVRQLDPSMAPGQQIQIETAQDGFRAMIVRIVTQGDVVIREDRFVSTYTPARNVFMHGPEPEPTPQPNGSLDQDSDGPDDGPEETASEESDESPDESPSPGQAPDSQE